MFNLNENKSTHQLTLNNWIGKVYYLTADAVSRRI